MHPARPSPAGALQNLSKGAFRTLKGFSTGAQGEMYNVDNGCLGCPYKHYLQFYDYYGDFDYADKWVSAALSGTDMTFASGKHGPNNFATLGDAARVEAVKKGTVYLNVWMYVIREFEAAIDDCTSCTSNCNEHSTNAWDEGVAFYTGSLEGTAYGGSTAGKLLYRLAEKQCANFGTCALGAEGTSQVNTELFALFASGRDLLQQGSCSDVRPLVDQIVSLMTVPLVQGALRSAYKNSAAGGDASSKNAAKGATFAAAMLPLVYQCSSKSAATVSDNLKLGLFPATPPDFGAVKSALEDVYACLSITCAQVGGLIDTSSGAAYAGAEACTPHPYCKDKPKKGKTCDVKVKKRRCDMRGKKAKKFGKMCQATCAVHCLQNTEGKKCPKNKKNKKCIDVVDCTNKKTKKKCPLSCPVCYLPGNFNCDTSEVFSDEKARWCCDKSGTHPTHGCNQFVPCGDKARIEPETFCGRGPGSAACGDGFYCDIAPDDAWAVCCPEPKPNYGK